MDNEPPQDKICNSGRFLGSLPFARNDMSVGGAVLSARVVSETLHGDESSPLHWVYRLSGGSIQPHMLSLQRGGRQIAAPTVSLVGSTSAPIVPTMRNVVPRLIHRLWRSPFPEGEGLGVLPLRLLLLQCGTWYRAAACGGCPSLVGRVFCCAHYLDGGVFAALLVEGKRIQN